KKNSGWSNMREIIFYKGSSLPLEHHGIYKTVRKLKKGDNDNPLNIIIDEGESETPDRNNFVCELGINGKDLPYDLPEGTEVEITVELNKSRELFVTAHIRLIDLTRNSRLTVKDEIIDIKDLETELSVQIEKAKTISENCTSEERKTIEDMIQSVQTSVNNAHLDKDEEIKANSEIKKIKIRLDKIEKEKEMPQLVKEFHARAEDVQKLINEYADEKDKDANNDHLSKMKAEGEKAISDNDKILLIRVNEQIHELGGTVWWSKPDAWIYYFQQLISENHNFTNEKEARDYIEKGKRAIELGNMDELRRCIKSLLSLLPAEEQAIAKKNLSGITL
ncbi:hypothetical protein KKB40_04730, partial [Patescibacteria group bacterium]|nr:hypothetical protein [Patescibacteria group bacterium]